MSLIDVFGRQDTISCPDCRGQCFVRGATAVMHECDTCNSVGFLKTNQQVVASKSEANYARDKVIQQMQREINKLRTVVVANDETGPTREMVYPENGVKRGACGSVYQGD